MSTLTRAAGIVVYRTINKNDFEYLLLKASYPPYHWTPPKGHVDPGETDPLVTALRETEEESGLQKQDIQLEDHKEIIHYDVKGNPKEVIYWLGKLLNNKEVILSDEHTELAWAPCEEAAKLIGFQTTGDIIRRCQKYLETKYL